MQISYCFLRTIIYYVYSPALCRAGKCFFEFLREKRAAYADCLSVFDSGEDIASVFASDARRGYDEYDCIEILRSLTEEDVFRALCAIDINNSAICIAENAKGKDKSL